MSWRAFEEHAGDYEAWYESPDGRRVDREETRLLARLIEPFGAGPRILEVGCGTGHFTRRLAELGARTIGLDRSPAMLWEAHRRSADGALVLGDARRLPFTAGAVDVVAFVATLEFLGDPGTAVREAARAARRGIVVVALNRWSVGGLSRRWGVHASSPLLGGARDLSLRSLRRLLAKALGPRLRGLWWRSTLLPVVRGLTAPLPFGDVIGMAATLTPSGGGDRDRR